MNDPHAYQRASQRTVILPLWPLYVGYCPSAIVLRTPEQQAEEEWLARLVEDDGVMTAREGRDA